MHQLLQVKEVLEFIQKAENTIESNPLFREVAVSVLDHAIAELQDLRASLADDGDSDG